MTLKWRGGGCENGHGRKGRKEAREREKESEKEEKIKWRRHRVWMAPKTSPLRCCLLQLLS